MSPDEFLFDPQLLNDEEVKKVGPADKRFLLRPLHMGDYNKGFLSLLAQLTKVGTVTEEDFLKTFKTMKQCPNSYYVIVIEDKDKDELVACSSLVVEYKFIHDAGLRGRLEDVVVRDEYRGKQLGKCIVLTVRQLAKQLGCYKMSLDCKNSLIPFYKSLDFVQEDGRANMLVLRFKD